MSFCWIAYCLSPPLSVTLATFPYKLQSLVVSNNLRVEHQMLIGSLRRRIGLEDSEIHVGDWLFSWETPNICIFKSSLLSWWDSPEKTSQASPIESPESKVLATHILGMGVQSSRCPIYRCSFHTPPPFFSVWYRSSTWYPHPRASILPFLGTNLSFPPPGGSNSPPAQIQGGDPEIKVLCFQPRSLI